jgi:dienelactone hydrolase
VTEKISRDPRVATATAHWAPRFVNNGVEIGAFESTLSRINQWEQWCGEWGVTAQQYEELARRAEESGNLLTAGQAWVRAALCWHFGKFLFTDDMAQQRAAHDRAMDCHRRGMASLDPPAERVELPYGGHRLAALLRFPAGTAARPGVVILVPGLDSVKEEVQTTADLFLKRGLCTLSIDGPGQGEAEYDLPIEPAYERVATAVVDWILTRSDMDHQRIGLFGVSLGGYYAVRAAAHEQRLRAAVGLAGPETFGRVWDELPAMTRGAFQRRSASPDAETARLRAGELTLEGISQVLCPTLLVHGRRDRIIPYSEAERIKAAIPAIELVTYDDGNHGVTNRAFESRSLMADWLAQQLA